jgi:hypothetical protein
MIVLIPALSFSTLTGIGLAVCVTMFVLTVIVAVLDYLTTKDLRFFVLACILVVPILLILSLPCTGFQMIQYGGISVNQTVCALINSVV